jgi:hypothetical protein
VERVSQVLTEHKLSERDLAICRAFSYKLQSHTTDRNFAKTPHAFHTTPRLPKIGAIRSRIATLSGLEPEIYHACINSCVAYTGTLESRTTCPFCTEKRLNTDGRPRQKFVYIPLIPRLQAFAMNQRVSQLMQYRHEFTTGSDETCSKPGVVKDVFDGELYKELCHENVVVGDETLSHRYFDDRRDVALGLSTDGFGPFKRHKHTCWPLIVFNYNLPPDIRFQMENILSLGVIPGPKKPKDPNSFLWPFVREMLRLAIGVVSFDILSREMFRLCSYLIEVFGDIPAISMIMRIIGHNGYSPCRMCKILGLRVPGSSSTTHYVPLERSRHPDAAASGSYDPRNLPLRSHDEMLEQAKHAEAAPTEAEATRRSRSTGIKGTSILFHLHSLRFPRSFPYDFMHLFWENLMKNLIKLWTSDFKGMDSGVEEYELEASVWSAVGEATASSGATIPSCYGAR